MADILVLFSAVAVNGTCATHDLGDVKEEFEVQVVTTGSPTFSLQLQGSLDGVNFYPLGAAITTTGGTSVTGNMARYVNAVLSALSGGTFTARLGFGGGL